MKSYLLLVVLVLSLVLVMGCVQQSESSQQQNTVQNTSQNTTQNLYQPPAGTPTLKIISPANGAVITGSSSVGIRVNVTNFRLIGITGGLADKQNEGHLHYYLDSTLQMSPYTSLSFANVQPGVHTIRVELVNNDHTSLAPPITDTVTITVQ